MSTRWIAAGAAVVALASMVIGIRRYERPVPAPTFVVGSLPTAVPGNAPKLPWPAAGGGAVGISDGSLIGANADDKHRPLASTTKIMTALVVLTGHPLQPNEQGPSVLLTADDVAAYQRAVADNQSAVAVTVGERLSEYQLLQGLLIPSANNFADILAKWDAGSVDAFVKKMNDEAKQLGLNDTHFNDASGNDPLSTGTARDLTLLAQTAMKNDVFASIVAQPQVDLPNAGTVYNVDALLGKGGIVGVKTGSSPEAGAVFVFAADAKSGDRPIRLIGAVVGQALLADSFAATQALVSAAAQSVTTVPAIEAGHPVGSLVTAWGSKVDVVTAQGGSFLAWPGAPAKASASVTPPLSGVPAGATVGSLALEVAGQQTRIPLRTNSAIGKPGLFWRLFH